MSSFNVTALKVVQHYGTYISHFNRRILFFLTKSTTTLTARQRKWRGARRNWKHCCQIDEIFE